MEPSSERTWPMSSEVAGGFAMELNSSRSERLPAGRRGYGMRTSDSDGDLSLCAAAFQVAYGLGHFVQRVGLAHDGDEVTGLDLLAQSFEVSLTLVSAGDVHGQPLGHHRREHERTKLPPDPGP